MGNTAGLERSLEEHPLFEEMSPEARSLIAGCASHQVFRDGDRIYREGDAADRFYLIRRGSIAVEVSLPGRKPLVIETLHDGEILGWSWLVPPFRIRFDARAVGLVRALSIDGRCLRAKCEEDHELGYEFFRRFVIVIVERLEAARLQMLDMYGHPAAYVEHEAPVAGGPIPPAKPSPDS